MPHDFRCNHCKTPIVIQHYEFFNLYEEGQHEIDCPHCQETIYVNSVASFSFRVTDEDGDHIID